MNYINTKSNILNTCKYVYLIQQLYNLRSMKKGGVNGGDSCILSFGRLLSSTPPFVTIMVRSVRCHVEIAHFQGQLLVCVLSLVYFVCTVMNMLCRVAQIRR